MSIESAPTAMLALPVRAFHHHSKQVPIGSQAQSLDALGSITQPIAAMA